MHIFSRDTAPIKRAINRLHRGFGNKPSSPRSEDSFSSSKPDTQKNHSLQHRIKTIFRSRSASSASSKVAKIDSQETVLRPLIIRAVNHFREETPLPKITKDNVEFNSVRMPDPKKYRGIMKEPNTPYGSKGFYESKRPLAVVRRKSSELIKAEAASNSVQASYRYDPNSPECIKMLEKLEAKFKTIKPGPPRDKATILASFARARTDLPLAADFFRDSNINLSPGAGYAGPLDFAIKYQRNQHEAPNNKLLTNCQFLTQKALYEGGNVKLSAYREDADDIKPKENTLHALFEQTTTIPNRDLPILNIYLDHASDKEDLKKAVMEASSDDLKLYNILLNLPAESVTNPQEIILTIEKIESITGVPLKDGAKNGKFWARHPALKEYVKRKDLQNLF